MARNISTDSIAVLALALSACGGGGSGIVSTPAPPTTTTTTPPPPPPPPKTPLQPPHIGLVSSTPFEVLGTGTTFSFANNASSGTSIVAPEYEPVSFSYDDSTGNYQVSLPRSEPGTLVQAGLNGTAGQIASSTFDRVTLGTSATLQPVGVLLPVPGSTSSPYSYTSWGRWQGPIGVTETGIPIYGQGYFAYGIPTAAGDVPTTGTGVYGAEIRGESSLHPGFDVTGDVNLMFDFGAGTLTGSMHPGIYDDWDGVVEDFGQFSFIQTVYSTGGTKFSGKFIVPGIDGGTADSAFEGTFTGPGAAELLARFKTPYIYNGQQGTIAGIWTGKKH